MLKSLSDILAKSCMPLHSQVHQTSAAIMSAMNATQGRIYEPLDCSILGRLQASGFSTGCLHSIKIVHTAGHAQMSVSVCLQQSHSPLQLPTLDILAGPPASVYPLDHWVLSVVGYQTKCQHVYGHNCLWSSQIVHHVDQPQTHTTTW
jgi:hypothetical protein